MVEVTEQTMLLRERCDLPDHLQLVTEQFVAGWSLVKSGDSFWLNKRMRARGWHFASHAAGQRKTGIGRTSERAISGALAALLRRLSDRFNAVGVAQVALRKCPGFFLATIEVCPYQIQPSATLSVFHGPRPFSYLSGLEKTS